MDTTPPEPERSKGIGSLDSGRALSGRTMMGRKVSVNGRRFVQVVITRGWIKGDRYGNVAGENGEL